MEVIGCPKLALAGLLFIRYGELGLLAVVIRRRPLNRQPAAISASGYVASYVQPSYTTYDAAVGVAKDAWNVQLFGQNLTNVNESTTTSSAQFVETETVTRPRIAGIKFGCRF